MFYCLFFFNSSVCKWNAVELSILFVDELVIAEAMHQPLLVFSLQYDILMSLSFSYTFKVTVIRDHIFVVQNIPSTLKDKDTDKGKGDDKQRQDTDHESSPDAAHPSVFHILPLNVVWHDSFHSFWPLPIYFS